MLVGVDVDPNSVITTPRDQTANFNLSIASGTEAAVLITDKFDNTILTAVASPRQRQFGKHPWASEVRITLKGGGPTGDLGCDQVVVQILLQVVTDTRGDTNRKSLSPTYRIPHACLTRRPDRRPVTMGP